MGVFTPTTKSPNHYPFGDRDFRSKVTPRPGDHLERGSDFDLEAVLAYLAPLPPYSALVGICEDGLPLLLDLKNPASGSILFVGAPVSANRPLLRSVLASAVLLNTVDEVQLYLVTSEGGAFAEFQEVPGSLEIINPNAPAAAELIWHLVGRTEQQPGGRQAPGIEVLLIDDLDVLAAQLDRQGCSELEWLVEAGPESGVWVIAGLDAGRVGRTHAIPLEAFPTHLIDTVDQALLDKQTGLSAEGRSELDPGAQYCAQRAGENIPFWLPRYTYMAQPEKRVVKGTT